MTSRPRTRIPSRPKGDHRHSRVIRFGDIPTVIPSTSVVAPETSTIAHVISFAAPMVETTLVASPTGLCGLISSEAPPMIPSDGPPLQDLLFATVAVGELVTSRPIINHMSFLLSCYTPPGFVGTVSDSYRPGRLIVSLFGRPYRTHLNGPLNSSSSSHLRILRQFHSGGDWRRQIRLMRDLR
ncbi:hypothetical protein Tco_0823106 [Tanacetum coccineum]|uniref:Uncharacterized protein n=1 Tax=Tanacetum coccineum TaxID=301880 RepID=A0ABQ5AJJ2_9ASTR